MAKRLLAHIRNQWIGTLALFIALATGSAYAVEQIQRNSIGAPQIKKSAVGTSELKDDKTKGTDVDESSLGQVPSAASAANADMLDSLDSTAFLQSICPAGTLFHEAACVETAIRAPANFDAATAACVNANRRLPSVAELQTFRLRVPISPPDGEWTSLEWENGATPRALLVGSNGLTDGSDQSFSNPFRCVATWP
jgi:hypothetical protein